MDSPGLSEDRPPQRLNNPVALAPGPWTTKDQPLTRLNARDLAGKTWTIAELKGKKTLINIWATWCEPCRQELPSVQKLYEQTKEIPRNWIVDSAGVLRQEGVGFSVADWPDKILQRIEQIR
jgi:thiol-disulfide isomerase/thioredoxin